jgi:hypothetical protein
MRYKGFIIKRVYSVGSDFTVTSNNTIKNRRPKKEDIEYYEILDPMEDNNRWIAEDTVAECKESIDKFLKKVGMKDNLKSSWKKLENIS